MALCFAFGKKERKGTGSDIFAIEYINYKILHKPSDSIDIVADMFFPNPEDKETTYYFIHRSNLALKPVLSETILSDNNFYSAFLKRVYAPSLGCRVEESGRIIGLIPYGINEINLRDADRYSGLLSRIDPADIIPVPYTLYKIDIPPKACGFIRVEASLEKEVFNILTQEGSIFDVYGGWTLIDEITRKDIIQLTVNSDEQKAHHYKHIYEDFVNCLIVPARYDIVLASAPGTYSMEYHPRTSDLFLGCEDKKFNDRIITWYWSLSPSFLVSPYLKGPRLDVEVKTTKTPLKV